MNPDFSPGLRDAARMAQTPDGGLWVFGYGSLMWDPGMDGLEMRAARLYGYHRRFCLRSIMAWGTPERPGLCATLHPGGSVAGRAVLLPPARLEAGLAMLGEREAAYLPRHVSIHFPEHRPEHRPKQGALTFVFNPQHPRSAGDISHAARIALIRQGRGSRGGSQDYLARVVQELHRDGARDRAAEQLLQALDLKAGQ